MLKLLLVFSFVLLSPFSEDVDIKTINEYKRKAEEAFNQKDYVAAANFYTTLLDSFGIEEPELRLNLAHSYLKASQNDLAEKAYQQISATDNKNVNSLANKQLGAMSLDKKKYDDALKYFKDALRNNPSDYDNQYNYELTKKLLKEQQDQKDQKQNQDKKDDQNKDQKDQKKKDQQNQQQKDQKDQQKKDQQQKDPQKQEQKDGEEKKEQDKKEDGQKDGEKKDEKKDDLKKSDKSEDEKNKEKEKKNAQQKQQERLQKINMSAAKAKMILDAMKNNETKYYQQLKRKSAKKKDRSKPDW